MSKAVAKTRRSTLGDLKRRGDRAIAAAIDVQLRLKQVALESRQLRQWIDRLHHQKLH